MQWEIILQIIGSFLLGYIVHILQIRFSKKKILSDRLVDNINDIEKFIALTNEVQYEQLKLDKIGESINFIDGYIKSIKTRIEENKLQSEKRESEIAGITKQLDTYERIIKKINKYKTDNADEKSEFLKDWEEEKARLILKLQDISEDPDVSRVKLIELESELNKSSRLIKDSQEKLKQATVNLEKFEKQIALSDIDALCLHVDPKGNLINLLNSLADLIGSGENRYEILQTKIKIKNILTERIKKS